MTRAGKRRLIAAAAALLAFAVPASRRLNAECDRRIPTIPVTGAFCGVARSVVGDLMTDSDIVLLDGDGHVAATARTDARGRFRFPPVPPGIYHYTSEPFARFSDPIEVVNRGAQCARRFEVTFVVLTECGGNWIPVDQGTLHLTGDADHVTGLVVDGRGAGFTQHGHSLSAELEVGAHHVVVTAIFYEPLEFDVVIRRDRTTSRRISLVPSRL